MRRCSLCRNCQISPLAELQLTLDPFLKLIEVVTLPNGIMPPIPCGVGVTDVVFALGYLLLTYYCYSNGENEEIEFDAGPIASQRLKSVGYFTSGIL